MTAFSTNVNSNIFCGYCYDGMMYGTACTSHAECGSDTCTSRADGAFRNHDATEIALSGTSPGTCVASGTHPITLVDTRSIRTTNDTILDTVGSLPGPSASSFRGTIEFLP